MHFDMMAKLQGHPLLRRLGGLPSAVRWAARRLVDTSVEELQEELRMLRPQDMHRLVQSGSPASAELAPLPIVVSKLAPPKLVIATALGVRERHSLRDKLPPTKSAEGGGHEPRQVSTGLGDALTGGRPAAWCRAR